MSAVSVHDVSRVFTSTAGEVEALKDVHLDVEVGTMAAIRGRSGSGKTTLLNLVGALDRPSRPVAEFIG